ncbi:uncharacterized protein LOC143881893 [Tasmannia lanceolata]|uniref:uncharacterized protein LOC143881893 n=1 Tax=Tasmannia lanceolata TaxID=3420 RepID=UPI0040628A6B
MFSNRRIGFVESFGYSLGFGQSMKQLTMEKKQIGEKERRFMLFGCDLLRESKLADSLQGNVVIGNTSNANIGVKEFSKSDRNINNSSSNVEQHLERSERNKGKIILERGDTSCSSEQREQNVSKSLGTMQNQNGRRTLETITEEGDGVDVPQLGTENVLGNSYESLPQAVEEFSRSASKARYKECGSSSSLGNVGFKSDSLSSWSSFKFCRKRKRSIRKRTRNPVVPMEKDMVLKNQEVDKEFPKNSTLVPVHMGSSEVNKIVPSFTANDKAKFCTNDGYVGNETGNSDCGRTEGLNIDRNSNIDMDQDRELLGRRRSARINGKHVPNGNIDIDHDHKLIGLRRSARINGKHVPVDSESDLEMEAYENCLDSSIFFPMESSLPEEEMGSRKVHEMVASTKVDEKAKPGTNDECLSIQDGTSDCGQMANLHIDQNSEINMHDGKLLGGELDIEKGSDDDCLELSKCVLRETSQPMGSEDVDKAVPSCMVDEKATGSESLSNQTNSSDFCRMMDVQNVQNSNSNTLRNVELRGVRRSPRISDKHVPVDSELDVKNASDDCFLNSSKWVVNGVTKDIEEPGTATLGVENTESRIPTLGKKLTKQRTRKKIDCQNVSSQRQLRSRLKKSGVMTRVSEKCSPSPKKIGTKAQVHNKCSSSSTRKRKSVGCGNSSGKKKKKRNGGCGLMARRTTKEDCEEKISPGKKVSLLSWLIDSGMLTDNEKIVYKKTNGRGGPLTGWVTRAGIQCNCCQKVVTLLEFEAHAGSNLQQHWDNTCLVSGKSLTQCLRELWEKEKKLRNIGLRIVGVDDLDPTDDKCGVCADGGDLIICDSCPSTFHQDCVKLKALPKGSWYCPHCRCEFCKVAELERCKTIETFILLACNQCGRRYHRECSWGHDMRNIGSLSSSFCGENCEKVATGLSDMLGVSNPIGSGFTWTLLRRLDGHRGINFERRLSFIMECNVKLSLALFVLDECFDPLVDPRTDLDMISQAVYNCGSNFRRLNYERFHTIILEKGEEIIAVATLRFHGTRLAEMPFIGTRPLYRRQGMCRRLMKAIEEMLSSLCVEKLIIPAIPELLDTWRTSFSFKPLDSPDIEEIRNLNLVVFAETTMLQKSICNAEKNDDRGGHIDSGGSLTGGQDVEWVFHKYGDVALGPSKENKFEEGHIDFGGSLTCGQHVQLVYHKDGDATLGPSKENKVAEGHIDVGSSLTGGQNVQLVYHKWDATLGPSKENKFDSSPTDVLSSLHSKFSWASVPEFYQSKLH